MKSAIITLCAIALVGCATTKHVPEKVEPTIVPRLEYIVKIPPAELVQLPAKVPDIDVDTATQADVARWINANEGRTNTLENIIISIMKFLKDEQTKADAAATKENEKVGSSGDPTLVIKPSAPASAPK